MLPIFSGSSHRAALHPASGVQRYDPPAHTLTFLLPQQRPADVVFHLSGVGYGADVVGQDRIRRRSACRRDRDVAAEGRHGRQCAGFAQDTAFAAASFSACSTSHRCRKSGASRGHLRVGPAASAASREVMRPGWPGPAWRGPSRRARPGRLWRPCNVRPIALPRLGGLLPSPPQVRRNVHSAIMFRPRLLARLRAAASGVFVTATGFRSPGLNPFLSTRPIWPTSTPAFTSLSAKTRARASAGHRRPR